ncbi:MAG: hypothetical protein V3V41_10100 [Candidatus Heimdallarchaeota archaeon]
METSTKTPFDEFSELYAQIKDKLELLPSVLSKLTSYTDTIVKDNSELKVELKEIDDKFNQLQSEYQSKDSKISDAEKLAAEYKSQLESVDNQMKGLRDMYEDLAQERAQDLEIQDLLAIYTVLFEQIFASDPLIKILLLLQGVDKEVWTRDEFVKTTGFTPAAIMKALHDLRNNEIIELNESATEARLIKSLLEPKTEEESKPEEESEI